jgi:hypothetical protein
MKRSFSEAETQAILARAVEIDAKSPDGLSPEQLESIAVDLGISPSALQKAMAEFGGPPVKAEVSPAVGTARTSRSWKSGVIGGAVAVLVIVGIVAFFMMVRIPSRAPAPSEAPADVFVPAAPAPAAPAPAAPTRKATTKRR